MNEEQRAAAEAPNGYVQIIAGPGTGKTVTMVGRILELVKRGIDPHRIAAMTFTRAAASELRERVINALGNQSKGIMIGTFHSLAMFLMRKYGEMQRLNIRILSDHDAISICREIEPSISPRTLLKLFKMVSQPPERLETELLKFDKLSEARIRDLEQRFRERRHALNFYDFDEILELFEDFLKRTHATTVSKDIDAVLVDEFQDTCLSQLRIAMYMASECGNMTVVGDPKQSIYAFRGAVPKIFDLMKEFEGVDVREMPLRVNYRSTQPILDVAQRVLLPRQRGYKPVQGTNLKAVTSKASEVPVQIVRLKNGRSEASLIAEQIRKLLDIGVSAQDICVLSASSRAFMSFESAFMAKKIGIRMVGGRQLLRSGAITVFIDYIRVSLDGKDSLALKRTLNNPARGIGPKTMHELESHDSLHVSKIRKLDVKGICDYISQVDNISDLLDKGSKENVRAAIEYIGANLFPNVAYGPLLTAVDIFADDFDALSDSMTFAKYFVNLWALGPDTSEVDKTEENRITCSTIHSAKGLEWPIVFVLGVDRPGFFAAPTEGEDSSNEEELRRLLFVALTRAKRFLTITLESNENDSRLNIHPLQKASSYFRRIDDAIVNSLQSCLNYRLDISKLRPPTPANDDIQFAGFRTGLDVYKEEKENAPQKTEQKRKQSTTGPVKIRKTNQPSVMNFFKPK